MRNHLFPSKKVFFVDVTKSKIYGLVCKRHKTEFYVCQCVSKTGSCCKNRATFIRHLEMDDHLRKVQINTIQCITKLFRIIFLTTLIIIIYIFPEIFLRHVHLRWTFIFFVGFPFFSFISQKKSSPQVQMS